MNFFPYQNGKVLEKTLALTCSRSDPVKTTLKHVCYFKLPSLFFNFFKYLSPFLCHIFAYSREYYEWLCRLKHHIQVGRLPVQGTWVGLVSQSVIWGSMWPTGQTSHNSVIVRRWWRCALPSGPSMTSPHPISWLETHFGLLAKIIEYTVFQLSFSHWFVLIETV